MRKSPAPHVGRERRKNRRMKLQPGSNPVRAPTEAEQRTQSSRKRNQRPRPKAPKRDDAANESSGAPGVLPDHAGAGPCAHPAGDRSRKSTTLSAPKLLRPARNIECGQPTQIPATMQLQLMGRRSSPDARVQSIAGHRKLGRHSQSEARLDLQSAAGRREAALSRF